MTDPPGHNQERIARAVRTNYNAQREAMLAADADALDALLTDGFALTHMTGYVQLKAEWLADVRSGAMTYHEIEDVDVSVDVDSEDAVVTARTRTRATIWGSSGLWPLQLRVHFTYESGQWLACRTVAATWK